MGNEVATQGTHSLTLIIDNYDSFTYNLVHLVAGVGGELPVVVRNDDDLAGLKYDRVIISPGPGRPDVAKDFGGCMDVIRNANVPVLGVCLGHQGIACVFGGSVLRADPAHGRLTEITHDGDELFRGIPYRFSAVRYHSLAVAEPLPAELKRTACTRDGALMGLRHRERPIWGVQFHPESILSEYGSALIANFLGTAR